jgi:glycine/D-amino acid oxidase-like deaminating enzyme
MLLDSIQGGACTLWLRQDTILSSTSFWQADFRASDPSYSTREPLRGRQETDIAIVGAGIRARVLEARSIAAAASGRNGGFIADGTTRLYAHAITSSEREAARRVWAFSVANHAYAEAFVQELEDQGWGCDYRRNGSYKLAVSAGELGPILESARLLNEDGWAAQVVQRDEMPPRLRKVYFGGAFLPANAEIQPVRFVTGLARLAEQAGAVFSEESPVTNITIEDDGVTLTTPQGTLHAQKLILATSEKWSELPGWHAVSPQHEARSLPPSLSANAYYPVHVRRRRVINTGDSYLMGD